MTFDTTHRLRLAAHHCHQRTIGYRVARIARDLGYALYLPVAVLRAICSVFK